MIKIYDYYRSSACYRLRIALNLKGIAYEAHSIDLFKGEQNTDEYRAINPQGVVPYLIDGDVEISESLSIMEYLDETYGEPLLVFGSAAEKAYIRQLSLLIASGAHPYTHPAVFKGYLQVKLGITEEEAMDWYAHWTNRALGSYEALLSKYNKSGTFSFSDQVSMADLCLIPQVYNARRFNIDLSAYPLICAIEKNCIALQPFQDAAPETHPDAPEDLEQIHGPQAPLLADVA